MNIRIGLLSAALLLQPLAATAQVPGSGLDECRGAVTDALGKEHRLYRAVLLGRPKAEDAPVSTVRYDTAGKPWIKIEKDEWKSADLDSEPITDSEMDEQMETDSLQEITFRKGIFAQRGVLTSSLIPRLTQSFRAFECRALAQCQAAYLSREVPEESEDTLEISITGCMPMELAPLSACKLNVREESTYSEADVLTYCNPVVEQMMEKERQILLLLIEYDAVYRSLLQFSGMFDSFLGEWRHILTGTLYEATRLTGIFDQLPCFIGSCDVSPPENATP